MSDKLIIRKKDKIKSGLQKLRWQYETNLLENKIAFKTKLTQLEKQKKSISAVDYKSKKEQLKTNFKTDQARIKKTYENDRLKCIKNNTLSLDEEQFDQHKAQEVFTTPNKASQAFRWLTLSKNQKAIYKKLVQNQLDQLNTKKSTFLKCLNRMHQANSVTTGAIYFHDGTNIMSKNLNVLSLRTRVGMIFQKPTPFPMSIYDNVAYGPRSHGISDKNLLDKIVQDSLKQAALWDEVKDKLFTMGTALSGGQQQRLCIARAIALKPEVLLMDESTSGLDPIATAKIENLMYELKKNYTIILVSHSMAQVQRVADNTAFFFKGHLIEYGSTKDIFIQPKNQKTKDYLIGKIS